MGLLGAPFAEDDGGYGGGPVETMIVMEEFGKALALEPYLQTVVLCGALIKHGASPERRAELIGKLAAGELRLAFAQAERQSGYDLHDVALTARKDGGAFVLNGEKGLVGQGDSADMLIVSARLSGDRRDRGGIGLFLVDANAPGVSAAGLSDPGRPARSGDRFRQRARRAAGCARRPRRRAAGHRARGRRDDRRALGRGGRRHERGAGDDGRIYEDPQAVRRHDRLVPGAAASRLGHEWWRSSRRAA